MPNPKPSQKNLLIAFDAFGTLFSPRAPIGAQYGEIARKHGICSDVSDEEIMDSFKKAFKHNAKERPNYGKEVGMDPTAWWSSIISQTFTPLVNQSASSSSTPLPPSTASSLPHRLIPDLLTRFASRDGYALYNDVIPLFTALRAARSTAPPSSPPLQQRHSYRKIITAIVTNSDDRVAGILRSFGLRVGHVDPETVAEVAPFVSTSSPSSAATTTTTKTAPSTRILPPEVSGENDLDFVLTSYDCGYEKPHRAIFDAAMRLAARERQRSRRGGDGNESAVVDKELETNQDTADGGDWEAVYVGDEVDKDVVGAEEAGWAKVFLVDREGLVAGDAEGVVRRDVGGEGVQEVKVLRDLRDLEGYVFG